MYKLEKKKYYECKNKSRKRGIVIFELLLKKIYMIFMNSCIIVINLIKILWEIKGNIKIFCTYRKIG